LLNLGALQLILVKDRLAAYYFWNDQQSLAQAILVAKSARINMSEIKRWSQTTGNMNRFKHSKKDSLKDKLQNELQ
jgi:hypothetical protein